jgi:hypothetical protein
MNKPGWLERLRERRRRRDTRRAERSERGRLARSKAEREHAVGHQLPGDAGPGNFTGGVGL